MSIKTWTVTKTKDYKAPRVLTQTVIHVFTARFPDEMIQQEDAALWSLGQQRAAGPTLHTAADRQERVGDVYPDDSL